MGHEELNGEYRRLRSELDAAYSGPIWNSDRIDRIAERIAHVEYALASAGVGDADSAVEPAPSADRNA
ncbi:MAG: hypothetical protein ACREXI_01090 [Caldimonas sp.]